MFIAYLVSVAVLTCLTGLVLWRPFGLRTLSFEMDPYYKPKALLKNSSFIKLED